MPLITPPGGPVDWPQDEGTLGVIGVAPWATMEFCKAFYSLVSAAKDWHYPRVLLDINTKLPSRGRHLELGETDPSPYIAASIVELAASGATVIVVPCNTAHILYDRWAAHAPVPVPNIIEETVAAAIAAGGRRIMSLNSAGLSRSGKYEQAIVAAGGEFLGLSSAQQALITQCIEAVKQHAHLGGAEKNALRELAAVVKDEGCDAILLGCTELSESGCLLREHGFIVIDSNVALARAAAREINLR